MIRWSYLIHRVAIVAIFWCLLTFGLDPFLHWSFESAGGLWPGADLKIAALDAQVISPSLQLETVRFLELR